MVPLELEPGEAKLVTVKELLTCDFFVPPFQRPYDWEREQVVALIQDLVDSARKKSPLFLGMTVVSPNESCGWSIIDGQQRLTTLMLALAARGALAQVVRPNCIGLSTPWVSPRESDLDFARALLSRQAPLQQTRSQRLMAEAFDLLSETKATISDESFLDAQVIVYVSPSLAGGTRLFERINLRGKDVSQFDLVKNKLIDWAGSVTGLQTKRALEELITRHYDQLYQQLDVGSTADALNSDKLLRLHWILFSDKRVKPADKPLEQIEGALQAASTDEGGVTNWIERYLQELVRVAQIWVTVERPYEKCPARYSEGLKDALLDFARVNREEAMQPLIVAAILRWGNQAENLVRFCEISSFRSALAKKNSNQGRSFKWRIAQELYKGTWKDARRCDIASAEDAVYQLYWNVTPYWNQEEATTLGDVLTHEYVAAQIFPDDALESERFYFQYQRVVNYLFFKYGRYLPSSKAWGEYTREDISPLQDGAWFGTGKEKSFREWDIEHIYPQNPDDVTSHAGRSHQKVMAKWLHHLGNLTVLPIRDNRGMQNAAFAGEQGKLEWLRNQRKVSFNELLAQRDYRGNLTASPRWDANNCRKRVQQIRIAAHQLWGLPAIERLGVGPMDGRYNPDLDEELEDEEDEAFE